MTHFFVFALLFAGNLLADNRPAALRAMVASSLPKQPHLVVDLDALDRNIEAIQARAPRGTVLRWVEKSLPSADVLNYVIAKTSSARVLVFHPPFLPELQRKLPAYTDFFFGKPVTPSSAADAARASSDAGDLLARTTWLVDSAAGLRALVTALGAVHPAPVRVALEFDVGLRRTGVTSPAELSALLAAVRDLGPSRVQWRGVLGYDGHVPHVPAPTQRDRILRWTFNDMLAQYNAYVTQARTEASALAGEGLATRQGGGSLTLPLYENADVVNDLAVGSALFKPADFDDELLSHLQPALFVATAVMKVATSFRIPFLPPTPTHNTAILWGGGWNSASFYPSGWAENSLLADGSPALVPNQGSYFCRRGRCDPLHTGDWMLFRPTQSDRMLQFDSMTLVRGARVTGGWKPLERRY